MIRSKQDYRDYLSADAKSMGINIQSRKSLFIAHFTNPRWKFIKKLRKVEFYKNSTAYLHKILYVLHLYSFKSYGLKLGFSIPPNVCGKGLSLPHYGTIVISKEAKIGENARIHICVNIGESVDGAPNIGNNVYIGPGVKIFGPITLGNNVVIGANAVVNKSFMENDVIIAGVPAKFIKNILLMKSKNEG